MAHTHTVIVDVAIIGGGITGLWLLNALHRHGYETILLERSALGDGQTILSQGMIHGGVKYALGGRMGRSATAVAAMPERWRRCLQGAAAGLASGDVDLRGVPVLSQASYLWSNERVLGKLATRLASRLLRGRVEQLHPARFPAPFDSVRFQGALYRLNDLVLDVPSLIRHLAAPHRDRIWRVDVTPQRLGFDKRGRLAGLQLDEAWLRASRFIFAAGAGNAPLMDALPSPTRPMQKRPLHQVLLHDVAQAPLYAHYIDRVTAAEPGMTVTSHPQRNGAWSWYLGGRLAAEGVARTHSAQIEAARRMLREALPWLDLDAARFQTIRVDRAEPSQARGSRPDDAFVEPAGNAIICWPTKLSLVPVLAERVLAELGEAAEGARVKEGAWPSVATAPIATPPWEE